MPKKPTGSVSRHSKSAIKSGFFGSALEFYDFFIYTQAAAIVFPTIFFPETNPRLAIVASLATFGVGYVARPIGAFVLGGLADSYGRRRVLIFTMLLMGIATFGIGVLPNYQQIGLLAPCLLVLCRLAQGFAVAGEIAGSSALILEHAPHGTRGYQASLTLQGTQAGQIVAAFIFIPMAHFLSHEQFFSWGWRIPFLISAILVVIGMKIRLSTVESARRSSSSGWEAIKNVFQQSPKSLLRVAVISLMNVIPVTTTVFGATYATQEAYGLNWPSDLYLWIPVLGNILSVIIIPQVGRLSDHWGRRPVIITGSLLAGVFSFGYLWSLSCGIKVLPFVFSLLMWGAFYQGYNAVFPSFFPELFPASVRVSGMAIGQNIGTALSSLLSLVFAVLAPPGSSVGQVVLMVGGATFLVTVICSLTVWFSPETHQIKLATH